MFKIGDKVRIIDFSGVCGIVDKHLVSLFGGMAYPKAHKIEYTIVAIDVPCPSDSVSYKNNIILIDDNGNVAFALDKFLKRIGKCLCCNRPF